MPHSIRKKNITNDDQVLSRFSFRLIIVTLTVWLIVGSVVIYLRDISIWLGVWDRFSINEINYSKYIDNRESAEIFEGQLIRTRQGYRNGALIVGPTTLYSRELIPVDSSSAYMMNFDVSAVSNGANGKTGSYIFAGIVPFDKNKNQISNPRTHLYGVAWSVPVKMADGIRNFRGIFSPNGDGLTLLPADTAYIKLAIDVNYGDPTAAVIVSNIKFERSIRGPVGEKK
ncbi:hypothetical protein EDC30_1112 [Paucimonas lemoignei]|uniref:Uncharacterized protein n=1 Tax=Paucimonas lemoignei TaxID=29443 RepID=A0A4R3HTF0_PAULE|nr:hypothetical protein [Paucimonas lemoignei]TCS35089.1 hypothetical protein EDC30_1112 [Paucimonas lemoignei]